VLLTGSTGNLGAELLWKLLRDDSVDKIYVFNRPVRGATSTERHRRRFEDKGFDLALLESPKLVHLSGDFGSERAGLAQRVYDEVSLTKILAFPVSWANDNLGAKLRQEITVIIHNAWALDFNKTLSSFESHIRGTRNLIQLARDAAISGGARFIFTSSVAAAQGWHPSQGQLYPEDELVPLENARGSGYGESKYVAENVCANLLYGSSAGYEHT
jgi:thioester reductase-like protein